MAAGVRGRERKRCQAAGDGCLRHVIRPGPARAPPPAPTSPPRPRGSPRDNRRAPGEGSRPPTTPALGPRRVLSAPARGRNPDPSPGSARVMPHQHPSLASDIEESGGERSLYPPDSPFYRASCPCLPPLSLCHHPTGCQMWPRALNPSEVDLFGVRRAIWATGNNA